MSKYEKLKLIILTIFCLLALIILYNFSENGRYVIREKSLIILDSRSGKLYLPAAKKVLDISNFKEVNNSKK